MVFSSRLLEGVKLRLLTELPGPASGHGFNHPGGAVAAVAFAQLGGAVISSAWIWLIAAVPALTALRRAVSSARRPPEPTITHLIFRRGR
jgi:hypothetical protein